MKVRVTFGDALRARITELEQAWRAECSSPCPDVRRALLIRLRLDQYQSTIALLLKKLDTRLREAV